MNLRAPLAAAALLCLASSPVMATDMLLAGNVYSPNAPFISRDGGGLFGPGGVGACLSAGCPLSITITSSRFSSITDVPVSTLVDGWTGDIRFAGMSAAPGTISCTGYANGNCQIDSFPLWQSQVGLPNFSAPAIQIPVVSPGYNDAALPIHVSRTVAASAPLRQTYPATSVAGSAATVAAVGGDASAAYAFSDFVFQSDQVSLGSVAANAYNSGAPSVGAPNVPVVNNSTRIYPHPLGTWVTEPGLRFDGSSNATIEFLGGQSYGQNNRPLAAVQIIMSDGTNSVTKTVSALTALKRQYSTTCTATHGSNILQNCGSIAGFKIGQRLNLPGWGYSPVVGAIDATTTIKCTVAPCLELFVQMTATPRADGALTISALPSAGTALADGGFAGQRIEEPSGLGYLTLTSVRIVAPSATCGAGCGAAGSTINLPTPSQGQWATGMFLYDAAAAPCIPTDVYSQKSEFISAFVAGGASSLQYPSLLDCSGHTLTGLAIAANPGGSTVTGVTVSTTAASGVATSDTFQFDHDYPGSSGAVTVTAGPPVPVYAGVFTPSDFASLTAPAPGAAPANIRFRAIGYSIIGDQVLDTQSPNVFGLTVLSSAAWSTNAATIGVSSCAGIATMLSQTSGSVNVFDATTQTQIGAATACAGNTLTMNSGAVAGAQFDALNIGPNTNCDWFYFNFNNNSGACNPANAAWFPASGQAVSANLHNLPAFYDPPVSGKSSYAPAYVWVNASGTCGTGAGCASLSNAAPSGMSGYVSSIANGQTALKAFNNGAARNFAHNDINGGVFVLTDSTPYAGYGAVMTVTNWKPGVTFESGFAGVAAAPPGTAAAINPAVSMTGSAANNAIGSGTRFQNINLTADATNAGPVMSFDSAQPLSAFPTAFHVLDNVNLTGGASYLVYRIGAVYAFNVFDNEGAAMTHLLSQVGSIGVSPLIVGSTLICGGATNAAQKTAWNVFNSLGNITWNCPLNNSALSSPGATTSPWPLSQAIAYNKFMGMGGSTDMQPGTFDVPGYGMLLAENVSETINARTTNNHSMLLYADSQVIPASNINVFNNTLVGGRNSQDFVEGGSLASVRYLGYSSTVAGNLAIATYNVVPAFSRTRAGISGAPTATDDFNNSGQSYIPISVLAASKSIKFAIPCDFGYLVHVYMDTSATVGHLADVAQVTASASGTNALVVTAIASGALYPGATISGHPGLQIAACPGGGCNVTGTYTLTAPATLTSGTYYLKATNLSSCQVVYLIGVDADSDAAPVLSASFPARNYLKTNWFVRMNQMIEFDAKSDWSTVLARASGARIGNFEARYGAGFASNTYLTLPYLYTYFQYSGQGGETVPLNTFFNGVCTTGHYCNMSGVRYAVGDDRSSGGADTANPSSATYPGLNIGQGNYCPAPSATVAASASWAAGATTIPMSAAATGIVFSNMGVWDATSGAFAGYVASYSGSTLTLASGALAASSGSSDSLQFGALIGRTTPGSAMWPWDITGAAWGPGYNNGGAFAKGCY